MTTQLTERGQDAAAPSWRTSHRAATAAMLAVSATVAAAPFCADVTATFSDPSQYRATLHYAEVASVLAIASTYDTEVLRTQPRRAPSATYTTEVILDGAQVRAIAIVPETADDAAQVTA
ncbi:hypothetical protein [Streptomyces sp. NPDC060198]|uniref:hypothetical protein n=1 Tax=Streptomyces sp. NPDC060198 TaxID=3347070 RepID=UPI00365F6600